MIAPTSNDHVTGSVDIVISPQRITLFLTSIVVVLILVHSLGQFSRYYLGDDYLYGLVPLFTLGSEHNVPAYYSALAILFCSLLLTVIAVGRRRRRASDVRYWWGLAGIFLFLSVDEALEVHEHLIGPMQMLLNAPEQRYFVWLIPYAALLLVFGVLYARFILQLPKPTRRRFILAGLVYLSGAAGLEIVGGLYYESHGHTTLTFTVLESLEDALEMLGIVMFIHALASYICSELEGLRLRISRRS
jgi:hypothetical protein